jgi:hypothetical protein
MSRVVMAQILLIQIKRSDVWLIEPMSKSGNLMSYTLKTVWLRKLHMNLTIPLY